MDFDIVGELRRMARSYEAFKKAEEIATMFVSLEKREKEIKVRLVEGENELSKMEAQLEAMRDKVKAYQKELVDAEQARRKQENAIRQEGERQRNEQDILTAQVKAKAVAEIEALTKAIQEHKQEEAKAKADAYQAKQSFAATVADLAVKKQQLLKVFE